MASLPLPSAFLFLSLLLSTSLTAHGGNTLSFPPAEAPHPPHHHHRHHPALPPTPPPSHPHQSPPPPSHPHPPPPPPSHPHPPPPPPSHPPTPHPVPTPPTKPPVHPPVQPPSHPPVKPPTQPPVYPPQRKKVAIQGVVYCKSCKYRGFPTLQGASPLAGAVVKLECNNSRYPLREVKKTDKNGYFFFMPQALTTSGSHKCKVSLVSSPLAKCSVPTSLHGGASGAILLRSPKPPVAKPLPFELFTVGPFAFDAPKKLRCPY